MHDKKVNTKTMDATLTTSKNVALPPEFVGSFKTPYGVQYIRHGEAMDHANMLSAQMTCLIMMMMDEGAERFRNLSPHLQENLLWLVSSMSSELGAMFDLVASDALGSQQ